jgi:hypothetical protein
MTNPFDPRAGGPDVSQFWPPLLPDGRPPQPWEWAQAIATHAGDPAMAAMAGPDDPSAGPSSDDPMHVQLAYAVRDLGGGMTPDAPPDQNQSSPEMPGAAAPPGPSGAPWAGAIATPAAAQAPAPPNTGSGQATPASNVLTGFLPRQELSSGPDALAASMATDHPDKTPPGFVVDPKTGAVSRWDTVPTGNPMNPYAPTLRPATPDEKQSYLEQVTGAKANYPFGVESPEEQQDRLALPPQAPAPGADNAASTRLPDPTPGEKAVLDRISTGEGADYDTVYAYGHYGEPDAPVTSMTVGQAMKFQAQMIGAQKREFARRGVDTKPSSPIGRYQITQTTLQDFLNRGLITKDTVLTPEVQDRLARQRLMDAGLGKYLNKQMSETTFHKRLAGIWTSIETDGRPLRSAGGSAGTSWAQIKTLLGQIQSPGP